MGRAGPNDGNCGVVLMRGIVLGFLLAAFFLLFGCAMINSQDIKVQDGVVLADTIAAEKLFLFQEQSQLASFEPNYQKYSDEIGKACGTLNTLDGNKNFWSKDTVTICENKKGMDDCFFELEKIKTQIKNGDTDINLDSLDVLCRDMRSMGLQASLDGFATKYKAYGSWLDAEKDISAKWNDLSAFFSNSSSPELNGAKMSDYYKDYKAGSAKALASLQAMKSDCALKNDFKATSDKVEKICANVDGYLSDLDKADTFVLDAANFFGQFESGTVTIDSTFLRDCNQMGAEYSGLYDLKLVKDATTTEYNKTDLGEMCGSLENLSSVFSELGIPLVFENGELSSATKIELFKIKTVYVETDTAIGSGVIISSDSAGYYILTNAHVALEYDDATDSKYMPQYVRVKFYDGRVGYADELAYDQEGYDFVVLHVPSSGFYPTASFDPTFIPSDGNKVIAIGNPYGLEFSVTEGTISGIRNMGCFTDYCYGAVIQTDTAINPGNSGGGLWDYSSGDLLGINSLGLTQAEGLNFAISMYQYDKIQDTFKWYSIG